MKGNQEINQAIAKATKSMEDYQRTATEAQQNIDEIEKNLFRAEILSDLKQVNMMDSDNNWTELTAEIDNELFKLIKELAINYTSKKLQILSE